MAKRPQKIKGKSSKAKSTPSPQAKPARSPDWPTLALAAVGMVITAYLTGVAWWDAAPAFCGAGSSCDVIQQSRWSQVLGLPLALWGFILYALVALVAYSRLSHLKRWKRLWNLSLVGLVMSLYLTLVGLIALDAVCLWCLLSLATIAAIFVTNAVRPPPSAPEMPWWNWLLNSAILALVTAGAMHLYYNMDLLTPPPDPRMEALVEHLNETDANYYGASWCASCQRQRQLFGNLADDLPYVECSPYGKGGLVAPACTEKGIENYPTWIIDGERTVGVLTPEELANRSGFDWEQEQE